MSDEVVTKIIEYLRSYGWESTKEHDKEILVRFLGEKSDTEFHLIVDIESSWVILTIWPYLPLLPVGKETEALQLLCKKNFDMKLARLAMTDKGDVALCVDVPTDLLSESFFHLALDIISYYADIIYPEFVYFWQNN